MHTGWAIEGREENNRMEAAVQMDLFAGPAPVRWALTRPFAASRLRDLALRRLEVVRRHFPELDPVTIKVGRTKSRRAHAWASLDPEEPTVWIKPGALTRFTIAHEFTHLLQARGLAPRGEKAADLHALARHPELIDKPPSYLAVPRILFSLDGPPRPGVAVELHRLARRAILENGARPRRAVRRFEESAALLAVPGVPLVPAAATGGPP
jgi:hypothetical protein